MSTQTPEPDDQNIFGAVDDNDLDFGAPGIDPDAESTYSTPGFDAATQHDERVTSDSMFAKDAPTASSLPAAAPAAFAAGSVAPVASASNPQSPASATPVGQGPTSTANTAEGVGPAAGSGTGHKPGKKTLLIAGGGIAALLLAGGGFAAYQAGLFGAAGDQPSVVVPKNAFAYASIDLDPSASQKVNAYKLSKKFDSVKVNSQDSVKDDLLAQAFEDAKTVTYDKDIKPWLGDRAAVAAVPAPGTEDGVTALIAIQVSDEDAAKSGMAKAATELKADGNDDFNYKFKDEWVLIADNATELAKIAAAEQSLEDNPVFTHDMDALGDDQVGRAWTDMKGLVKAVPADAKKDLPADVLDKFNGSVVVGAHLGSDNVEVSGLVFGVPSETTMGKTAGRIKELPADTTAAVEIADLGPNLGKQWTDFAKNDTLGITEQAQQAGFELPDDLVALFGDNFAASFSADDTDSRIIVDHDDPAATLAVLNRLADLGDLDASTKQTSTGAEAKVAFGDEFKDEDEGSLGSDALFKAAMPDISDPAASAYVNLTDLTKELAEDETDQKDLVKFKAVGMAASNDGKVGEFGIRLLIK